MYAYTCICAHTHMNIPTYVTINEKEIINFSESVLGHAWEELGEKGKRGMI